MNHQILLVSADPRLAERVRWALPAAIATELHTAPRYRSCPDRRGWLLILLDAQAWRESDLAEDPLAALAAETAPMLWLHEPAWSRDPDRHFPAVPGRIVDYLNRGEAPSKLAFVLHQHLTAAYLHRMRLPPRPAAGAHLELSELQRQLNNALAGILGNAELALDASRRLPAPLNLRLQRIGELAQEMRDVLEAWAELATHPGPLTASPPSSIHAEPRLEAA